MSTPQQFRVFVGPHYSHYAWTNLVTGAVTDLGVSSRIQFDLNPSTVSIWLRSPGKFPSAGGVWVGGKNQTSLEYIRYTTKNVAGYITGLTREDVSLSNHAGNHDAEDWLYLWYPLDTNDGKYTVKWSLDTELAISAWDLLTVQGVQYQHWLFRNGHLVAIQTRADVTQPWGTLEYLGIIDSPQASDDHTHDAPWTLRVRPVVTAWFNQPTEGIKVGNLDIAKNSTATGSTPLVLPYDERSSGDFWAGAPDLSASATVDGDNDTLWIAERFMYEDRSNGEMAWLTNNADPQNGRALRFSQLYLHPPPGVPQEARFIELTLTHDDFQGFSIHSANGGGTVDWVFGSASVNAPAQIILTPDATVFAQYNPLSTAAILENRAWFDHVTPTGGDMWLRLGQLNQWQSRVCWGDSNHGFDPTKDGGVPDFPHPDAPSTQYRGGPISPGGIPRGQTLRYIHDRAGTNTASVFWDVGLVRHAGYKIDSEPDQWVMVTLPALGLMLRDDITATSPAVGEKLYIVNQAGGPSTAGLFGVGIVAIGDEWIAYSSKSDDGLIISGRARNGTVAAKHKVEDEIFSVEGNVPTNAHYISTIGWNRYNGVIYPQRFEVRVSNAVEPRSPDTDNWQADWYIPPGGSTNTHNQSAWSYTFPGGARIKAILVRIEGMNAKPARPRLNKIYANLETTPYASSNWLGNGVTVDTVIIQMLVNAGVPIAAIVSSGTFPGISDVETAADASVWNVVRDFASYAGVRIMIDQGSKIRLFAGQLWTNTTFSSTHVWTRSNAETIEQIKTSGLGISQVKINWRNYANSGSGTVVYPATPEGIGSPFEITEGIYSNEAAALRAATNRWIMARYPYTEIAGGVEGYPTMTPRQVHSTVWDYNYNDGEITRKHVVMGVDQYNEGGHLFTVAHLQRIERGVDW